MATPPPPNPIEQLQQRISALEKEASKPILLKFIEVTTAEKVALALGPGKVEGVVANIAVNAVKAEFNFFDPIKMLGLQDRYDEFILNRFRSEEERKQVKDQKPENLLAEANKAKEEIARAKNRLATVEERLDKPRSIGDMRKDISANRAWAKQQFDQLRGKKNPREDLARVKGSAPFPSVHRLQQQEQQLRKTIAQFVRVVKGAVPETAALADEMAAIERQLKK
ncbi:hypothetical protein QQY66_09550 [Streptomyces sp. DG2A-72]|uniref:hypothetical protein n=1 Tax=Streptomyces sp. DG2A-72 TaxID=3051386 RepID=UPI00265BF156|nr:hypothetical protein [Streptomyces sp. DG2A-72]MDO0931917.1 hypothetical protein [Streptomyces sp. DG2A-72]